MLDSNLKQQLQKLFTPLESKIKFFFAQSVHADQSQLLEMLTDVIDSKGRTTVQGIYAAGDVATTPFKQIIISIGEGAKVALDVFEDSMYAA